MFVAAGAVVAAGCGGVDSESVNAEPASFAAGARPPTSPGSGEAASCAGTASGLVIGPAAQDVPLNQPVKASYAALPNLYVIRDSEGLVALDSTCTHRGCAPNFVADQGIWLCPCHGSQYGLIGNLLKGPALLPMRRYAACKDSAGLVRIDVSKPLP